MKCRVNFEINLLEEYRNLIDKVFNWRGNIRIKKMDLKNKLVIIDMERI